MPQLDHNNDRDSIVESGFSWPKKSVPDKNLFFYESRVADTPVLLN